jgi:hypothetical protein
MIFVIMVVIIFFLRHRSSSWNMFSIIGNLVYAGLVSFVLIVLYRYVDTRGWIPHDLRSIVSDTAGQIEHSTRTQAQQNRVY